MEKTFKNKKTSLIETTSNKLVIEQYSKRPELWEEIKKETKPITKPDNKPSESTSD